MSKSLIPKHYVYSSKLFKFLKHPIFNFHFLRDEKDLKRSVAKIDWHPEGVSKLAVGYAIQRF